MEHLADPTSQINNFSEIMDSNSIALFNWYFYKGDKNEYPFHIDDNKIVEKFFETLQSNFLEVFHPILITTRVMVKSITIGKSTPKSSVKKETVKKETKPKSEKSTN